MEEPAGAPVCRTANPGRRPQDSRPNSARCDFAPTGAGRRRARARFLECRPPAPAHGPAMRAIAGLAAAGGETSCGRIFRPGGQRVKKVLLRNRRLIAESIESLIAAGSLVLSILLRFDFALEPFYGKMLLQALPLLVIVKIAVFRGFGLRDLAWRFIGFP